MTIDTYIQGNQVASGGQETYDGSGSSTGEALIASLGAGFDAEVIYEYYDGSSWNRITQFADDDGSGTFAADWTSQGNRIFVSTNERRLRINNVDSSPGFVSVEGDEI